MLVEAALHEAIESEIHARGRVAAQDEVIQRVECAEKLARDRAAFGGLRIDIGKIGKIRRQRQIAENRHAVGFDLLCSRPRREAFWDLRQCEAGKSGSAKVKSGTAREKQTHR